MTRFRRCCGAVDIPNSKLKVEIARILQDQGYVEAYSIEPDSVGQLLRIRLKYTDGRKPVITGLKRVSKPGRRVYARRDGLPRVMGGLGIAIVSTSRGVMTDRDASRARLGGEVLAYVW